MAAERIEAGRPRGVLFPEKMPGPMEAPPFLLKDGIRQIQRIRSVAVVHAAA